MPQITNAEDRLVRELKRGDEAALEEIIRRYTPYVGTIVWNILSGKMSEDDAKEVVSDCFYTLWQNREKLRESALKGYLASIARSRALNALRRAGRDLPLEDDALQLSLPGPEDETARREEYAALRRCVGAMGEPDRTIFIRHYYLYQTAAAIGQALGLNVNTVNTRLRRGRERLRRELEKGGFCCE